MLSKLLDRVVSPERLARRLISLITPCSYAGLQKVRVGNPNGDGGYVMLNDFAGVIGAISIGIGWDVSWDLEIAAKSIDVFQYDHTVAWPPIPHPRFHFQRIGIGPVDDGGFRTLDTMVSDISAQGDLILKVDVEGAEWAALAPVRKRTLQRFSQIVLEVHNPMSGTTVTRLRNLRTFRKLSRTHAVVHVHGNNYNIVKTFGRIRIPNVMEITYVRKSGAPLVPSREILPSALDVSNNRAQPDIPMSDILDQ